MTDLNDTAVNLLRDSDQKLLTITPLVNDAVHKLTEWCNDCHKTINDFYQQKMQELHSYIDDTKMQYEEQKTIVLSYLNQLKNEQMINEDNIARVESLINFARQKVNEIEQLCAQIHVQPLIIDGSYIQIRKKYNFQNLSLVCLKMGYSTDSSSAICSNENFLLMQQQSHLCLFDRNYQIVKQALWNYGWIRDMCWSSTVNGFIIITTNKIYVTNDQLLSAELFEDRYQRTWFSCTCSNKSLYLSTCEWGSSIFEINLSLPFDLVKEWKSPLTCGNVEGINDMKYNNETLALTIKDCREHKRRIELKSTSTFNSIWSLPLGATPNIRLFTCCSLKYNEWLVIDGADLSIYYITEQGKIREKIPYESVPYRANLFASNILAISTEFDLRLHRI